MAATTGTLAGTGALVTGASIRPGIGFAIAEALAAAGADIVVSGRREPDRDALAALESHGVTVAYQPADLTRPDQRQQVLEADHPSKAMVAPEDLGALAVFVAGEGAGQIRGAALPMDGGWTAR